MTTVPVNRPAPIEEHGAGLVGMVLLLVGTGISLLGDGLFAIAISFAVFELGGGALQLGAIVGTGLLVLFATILPAGLLADRWSRKWIASGSDLLRGCSQLATAAIVLADAGSVWWLLPTSVVFGIGTALHQPATVGFIAEVVPERRLVAVNGTIQALRGLSMMAGAALGGWLVDARGAGDVLVVDAATFLLCALLFACIRVPRVVRHEETVMRLGDGFRLARERGWILPGIFLIAGFVFVMLGPMQIVGPSVAEQSGDGASLWGTISATIAFGLILGGGAALAGFVRRPLLVVAVLLVVGASGHAALALDAPLRYVLPGYVALGAAMGAYAAMWESTKQRLVPRELLSRIGALDWFLSLIGMMSGIALASLVIAAASVDVMLWVMVAGAVVLAASTFVSVPLRTVFRGAGPTVHEASSASS
ncbi:MAG: transporter [Thermoleophilia bacterium]|nr:transporter [Thermoleophilia bacterium]